MEALKSSAIVATLPSALDGALASSLVELVVAATGPPMRRRHSTRLLGALGVASGLDSTGAYLVELTRLVRSHRSTPKGCRCECPSSLSLPVFGELSGHQLVAGAVGLALAFALERESLVSCYAAKRITPIGHRSGDLRLPTLVDDPDLL
jgi:hypothetical protein